MRFRLLGPLQFATGTGWASVRAAQQRLVMAVLVVEAGRTVTTERLVDELWGERPPATAKNTVQAYVMRLRKALDDQRLLATRPGGYQLTAEPAEIDSRVFEQGVADARRRLADHEPAAAAELLASALALWRGPALSDVPHTPFVAGEAARLEQLRLMAVETHMATELRLGRHVDVVGELSRLVAEHPLAESLRGQLMLALYRSGRRADALETYRRGHTVLVDELGVEPSRALSDLYRAILDDDPELAPEARTTQVAVRPHQLPPDIPDFTGRAEHVRRIEEALIRPGTATPVVAVTGRAGIGKTTVAMHVAHRLRESFPDGQLHVDLHGVDDDPARDRADPHDVLSRFLTALGMDGRAVPAGLDERAGALRSLLASRRLLMVLDNAADERQIRPLLPGTPGCAVLVTSRRRLTGLSATSVALDEFPPATALELLGRLVGRDRVAGEPAAAKDIVARCDHLPLAVRIVGARLAHRPEWTLSRLAGRLTDEARRLDELATGDLAVRTSLAASYAALDDGPRRAFRLLGVLGAPDVAAWVPAALLDTGLAEAEAHLDTLVDAQLVACADTGGGLRYRCHDLVRLFARERAEAEEPEEERAAAVARALGGWLALAAAADATLTERVASDVPGAAPRWPAPVDDVHRDPVAWFDAEHAALVAAVEQACRAGLAGHAWELANLAVNHFAFRGHYDAWRHTHEAALRACTTAGDGFGAAVLTRSLAYLRMTGVRIPRVDLAAALTAFRAAGERRGEADLLGLLAFTHRHTGDVDRAVRDGDAAMAIAEATGYDLGRCRLWYLRAVTHRELGRHAEATHAAEECLALAERVGTTHDRVLAMWELAAACRDETAAPPTRDRLLAGIDLCRARGERLLGAYLELAAAELELRFELADPSRRLQQALALFHQQGVLLGQVIGLRLAGDLSCRNDQPSIAVTQLTRAARLAATIGNHRERAAALTALGTAHRAAGATVTAVQNWQEALDLLDSLGDRTEAAAVHALLRDVEPALPST
jgi:DNA-binding SARP family transcriptional activator/tetratricopeptide (TPR) repeat protein